MSKLDGDARGGAALSVKEVIGRPIAFASTGEKLDEFEQFHPDRMAGRILGMGDMLTLIEQAEQAFEKDQAEAAAEKLLEGEFTLDDFLEQMQQLKKMGPLGGLLGMMPGMPKELKGAADRRRPAEAGRGDHPLDDPARAAQARAHQRQPAHPHRQRQRHHGRRRQPLVKQFGEMQKMMKRMGGWRMGGGKKGKKGKKGGFSGMPAAARRVDGRAMPGPAEGLLRPAAGRHARWLPRRPR